MKVLNRNIIMYILYNDNAGNGFSDTIESLGFPYLNNKKYALLKGLKTETTPY